jgi:histidyl-tRNA synthetase
MEKYSQELANFFENKKQVMSEDTAAAYEDNVFSPFYSSDEDDKILASSAPSIVKFLKKDNKKHYEDFCSYLTDLDIPFVQDHTLFFQE